MSGPTLRIGTKTVLSVDLIGRSVIVASALMAAAITMDMRAEFSIVNATQGAESHLALSDEGRMPDLGGAIGWLNSEPLNRKSLRGKVVLVDFWTYTCINSLRPLPYVKSWAEKYKDAGLVGRTRGLRQANVS